MINSGVPDTIVDFWLGHEIGDMAKAYKETQVENLRKMYLEREHLLSISAPKGEDEKTKAEVKEVKDDLYQLHVENNRMKQEIESLNASADMIRGDFEKVYALYEMIVDTPEGKAALKKLQEKKQEEALEELREAEQVAEESKAEILEQLEKEGSGEIPPEEPKRLQKQFKRDKETKN